jgi:hypothetical protein
MVAAGELGRMVDASGTVDSGALISQSVPHGAVVFGTIFSTALP